MIYTSSGNRRAIWKRHTRILVFASLPLFLVFLFASVRHLPSRLSLVICFAVNLFPGCKKRNLSVKFSSKFQSPRV